MFCLGVAAPEVVTRFKEGYDKACDIWSLGVIMYILLCGYAPFWGSSASDILRRVKNSKVDFPDREWQHISPEATSLVNRMLNRNSSMRPSAEELLEDAWFKGSASGKALPSAVPNLKRFNAKRKFRAEIEAIKIDNRMKKTILGLRVEALIIDMLRGTGELKQIKTLNGVLSARSADKTSVDKATFAAALTAECGVDAATASNHFDAFCAWKDSPTIRFHEYCHACLAVLPGDSAAKIDMAFGLYDVDSSGLIDRTEFGDLARNMLVGQANGVRTTTTNSIQCAVMPHQQLSFVFSLFCILTHSCPCHQEIALTAMIKDEFEQADKDGDGMVSLDEWRNAAVQQPRIAK